MIDPTSLTWLCASDWMHAPWYCGFMYTTLSVLVIHILVDIKGRIRLFTQECLGSGVKICRMFSLVALIGTSCYCISNKIAIHMIMAHLFRDWSQLARLSPRGGKSSIQSYTRAVYLHLDIITYLERQAAWGVRICGFIGAWCVWCRQCYVGFPSY